MGKLTHCHTIGAASDIYTRAKGAVSFLAVWGLGEFVGPLSPFILLWSVFYLPWYVSAALLAAMSYAFVVPEQSLYSPAWCRFVLSQAGWIKGGANLWVSNDVLALADRVNESLMVSAPPESSDRLGLPRRAVRLPSSHSVFDIRTQVCYHPHGLM